MRIILSVLLILNVTLLHAQEFSAPVSPNAASLGKYGEIPVNKFTGVPNISIPIYTIQEGDITVPISISFHPSGHKPGETASWVGLGWSLDAGGAITRNMIGTPDENAHFNNINAFLSFDDQQKLYLLKTELNENDPNYPADHLIKEKMWETINYDEGSLEADLFYYNFPGGAGKFQFEPDGNIISYPYSNLLFQASMNISDLMTGGRIFSFNVKSPEGLEYNFNQAEETYTNELTTGEQLTDVYNSAWYLSNIQSKKSNKSISFNYGELDPISTIPRSKESNVSTFVEHNLVASNWSNTSTITHIEQRYLKQINWSKGTVNFYKSDRLDVIGASKLDSIEVKNVIGETVKKVKFIYSYFNTDEYLRLEEVIEVATNGDLLPPYRFEYYPNVPSKNTKALDHYGYYNGIVANTKTLPYYYTGLYGPKIQLADREIYEDMPIVGMLKFIYYPTGGSTQFVYENNRAFGNIEKQVQNSLISEYCDADGGLYVDPVSGQTVQGLVCNQLALKLIEDLPQYSNMQIKMHLKATSGTQVSTGDATVTILEENNGSYNQVFFYDLPNTEMNTIPLSHLVPGKDYKISIVTNIVNTALEVNLEYTTEESRNFLAPGIRIKKIINKSDSLQANETTYYYTKGFSSESSGIFQMYEEPRYHHTFGSADLSLPIHWSGTEQWTTIVQDSPRNFGSFEGPTVYYSEVTTSQPGNGFQKDFYGIYPSLPEFSPEPLPDAYELESHQWKRGNQLREAHYRDTDSVLLFEKVNHYSFHNIDTGRTFVTQKIYDNTLIEVDWEIYSYAWNKQISGWARLDSTEEITYDGNNSKHKWTKNTFNYGPELLLPSTVNYINGTGQGQDQTHHYTYLNDQVNYVLSPVESTEIYSGDNRFISKQVINYSDFQPILTTKYDESSQPYHENSYTYDLEGNLKTILQSTGEFTEIHRGYNNTEPIAVVKQGAFNPDDPSLLPSGFQDLEGLLNAVTDIASNTNQQELWRQYVQNVLATYNCTATFYTHRPLVGITSITDSNGVAQYFEYDRFNRLEYVKDDKNNVVKSYEYNFQAN